MTTESTTPGVIPYVEFHTGPRRLLTIDLEGEYLAQAASLILPPGDGRTALHYATDYMSGIGSLGHPPQR